MSNKLRGLPEVFYINLDRRTDRFAYMESHLREYQIERWQRVSGCDAKTQDCTKDIAGDLPSTILKGEMACTLSHLWAIDAWLQTSDASDTSCIVIEDDCDLSVSQYWQFDWQDFEACLPSDYDVVQLTLTNPVKVIPTLHVRYSCDYSSAAYLINRRYAEKLMAIYKENGRYHLGRALKPSAKAEYLIFGSGVCYSAALFSYKLEFESDLNAPHVDTLHRRSRLATIDFWRSRGANLSAAEFTKLNFEYVVPRLSRWQRLLRCAD